MVGLGAGEEIRQEKLSVKSDYFHYETISAKKKKSPPVIKGFKNIVVISKPSPRAQKKKKKVTEKKWTSRARPKFCTSIVHVSEIAGIRNGLCGSPPLWSHCSVHQLARQDTRERQSPSISNLFFLTPCLTWDANGIPLADKAKFFGNIFGGGWGCLEAEVSRWELGGNHVLIIDF